MGTKTKFLEKMLHMSEFQKWIFDIPGSSNCYVLACFQEICRRWIEAARLYGCNIQAQTQTLIKCCIQNPVGVERTRQHFSLRIKKKGSNSCVFSWHHFPLNLLYHRRIAASCHFICWASESTCQSFCADEQHSGWMKAPQHEPQRLWGACCSRASRRDGGKHNDGQV